MATLVLGAVGTLVGGPLGGAVGSLLGRQVDGAIFGSPANEGPRLKDLAISSSSYGQPLARHFGRMRVAGSIIWSTDLVESEETSGGGKGQPKTTSFSYSISLAVALSSRPIASIGRIWADGNLLRGAAGDLKTGGTMRFYPGNEDQAPDPLMQAALGAECPAYRGLAYVVFEDLQLADFGNRIPALTFELLGSGRDTVVRDLIEPAGALADSDLAVPGLQGFSHEGGTYARNLQALAAAAPVSIDVGGDVLLVSPAGQASLLESTVPEPIAWRDGEFGTQSGSARHANHAGEVISDLRYYDIARDYQPGIQRASLTDAQAIKATLELPGAFTADDASALVGEMARRTSRDGERIAYRTAALDEALFPGRLVRLVDTPGIWLVESWEWRDGGVELELSRHLPEAPGDHTGEAGAPWSPLDRLPGAPSLRAFELPWDGTGPADTIQRYAAVSAEDGRWSGAQLFADRAGDLEPLPEQPERRAIGGTTTSALPPSPGLLFEAGASVTIQLLDPSQDLQPTSDAHLMQGANRALIGDEIIQFRDVEPLGGALFRLSGLLRGRGATEAVASSGHEAGARFTLLDARLVALESATALAGDSLRTLDGSSEGIEPVAVERRGLSLRPLHPVHASATWTENGSLELAWIRRARGAWRWAAEVEVPLVEETELYEVGIGDVASPLARFSSSIPAITLDAETLGSIEPAPGAIIWVRQVGKYDRSAPLLITVLP